MRRRVAPRAVRTAVSFRRVAVRAYTSTATFAPTIPSSRTIGELRGDSFALTHFREEPFRVGKDPRPERRVRVGKIGSPALPDNRQLRLRRRQIGVRGEPSEDVEHRAPPAWIVGGLEAQRHPVVLVLREAEAVWHDADHRVRRVADDHRRSHDAQIGVEAPPPLVIADDEHRRRPLALVIVEQKPSMKGRHPRDAERRRADLRDAHRFCRPIGRRQIPYQQAVSPEIIDGLQAAPPRGGVMERARLRLVRLRIPVLDRDPWRDATTPMMSFAPPAAPPGPTSSAQAGMISRNSSGSLPALPVM